MTDVQVPTLTFDGEIERLRERAREAQTQFPERPGISTTGDPDLLVLEAEHCADGDPPKNPHLPLDESTLTVARERIAEAKLTPAWEVAFDA